MDPRPGRLQEMSNLICALFLLYPSQRNCFGFARRCIRGWRPNVPSQSSVPLTRELMLAFSARLLQIGRLHSAVALALSWSGYLRASEALDLTWDRVALPGDVRLAHRGTAAAGVNIVNAKTGPLQFVPIHDKLVVRLLQTFAGSRRAQNVSPTRLFCLSYHSYLAALKETALFLGSLLVQLQRIQLVSEALFTITLQVYPLRQYQSQGDGLHWLPSATILPTDAHGFSGFPTTSSRSSANFRHRSLLQSKTLAQVREPEPLPQGTRLREWETAHSWSVVRSFQGKLRAPGIQVIPVFLAWIGVHRVATHPHESLAFQTVNNTSSVLKPTTVTSPPHLSRVGYRLKGLGNRRTRITNKLLI